MLTTVNLLVHIRDISVVSLVAHLSPTLITTKRQTPKQPDMPLLGFPSDIFVIRSSNMRRHLPSMRCMFAAVTLFTSCIATSYAYTTDSIPATAPTAVSLSRSLQAPKQIKSDPPRQSMWEKWGDIQTSFSVQSDMIFSLAKAQRGYKEWMSDSYVSGTIRNNYLEFGIRYEDLLSPMPGHEDERGRGIPHFHLKGTIGKYGDITVGDFYSQFGSGILFRSYEERNLGIDNAVRGVHVALTPYNGIRFKAFTGQQRFYFDRVAKVFNKDRGFISGADAELSLQEWIPSMQKQRINFSIGGSYVNKQEGDEIIPVDRPIKGLIGSARLNLPKQVHAFGGRARLSVSDFVLNGEYAYKTADPTATNLYIYAPGSVAMLSASYSQKGLSAIVQAKRSENFNNLSKRSQLGTPLHINHLPAFTANHTYTLAALYPYATQPNGEWAFQADFRYTIPRKTFLGGKYGTALRLNYSHVRGLKNMPNDALSPQNVNSFYGTDGYKHPFFGMGELYYSDLNFEVTKKVNKDVTLIFNYYHQIYNQEVVEGHAINGPMVWSNIFVFDGKFRLSPKYTLRTELQYLYSRQAEGQWIFGLAELSMLPNWMFTISDQYNISTTKEHYYMGSVTYSHGSHRLQLGYGRTRAGINCSGGVCRYMPETKGIYLTYNGSF